MVSVKEDKVAKFGIRGLDDILCGGMTPHRLYLVQGTPGTGKTTLALQFLMQGVEQGEPALYVTLSETRHELEAVVTSHGWTLDGISVYEMPTSEQDLDSDNQQLMFQPSEMELNVTTKAILAEFEKINPTRVVIDSLSEIRLLAQSSLRYRRQILALKQYFAGRKSTVLFLDDRTAELEDMQLESIAHGVINLEQTFVDYGNERRRLRINKMRGKKYRGGYHDYVIDKGGLKVFPRLVAGEHSGDHATNIIPSGIPELDNLLGGGIECGTSMLLLGPAGSGKSSLALQYVTAAAKKGRRAAFFSFDERTQTMIMRAEKLKMNLVNLIKKNLVTIQPIDPAELSPGEFGQAVRDAAEGNDGYEPAQVVVIDSLNGYLNAMPEERFLTSQLHELLTYLGHKGVLTILVVAQHGLLGQMNSPFDTSYLADTVLLLRYYETEGEVRQVISAVKKRSGQHERSIREFNLTDDGIEIGEPLRQFEGILTGTPFNNVRAVINQAAAKVANG